jgi:serine/threonine protein kinase
MLTPGPLLPQYCQGGELFSELAIYRGQRMKYMPSDKVRSYFIQLVFALHYMHDATERGDKTKKGTYVHRDIKPENSKSVYKSSECSANPARHPAVLFADKEKTVIKIGDFGIASYLQPGKKLTSSAGVSYSPYHSMVHLAHATSRHGGITRPRSSKKSPSAKRPTSGRWAVSPTKC